jgi:hypothetical protein
MEVSILIGTLAFCPSGELFVCVGSICNECRAPSPQYATLQRVVSEAMRSSQSTPPPEIFASGLRNSLAFGWHPSSGRMYAFDNGIDGLGNDEQSEELNEISPASATAGHTSTTTTRSILMPRRSRLPRKRWGRDERGARRRVHGARSAYAEAFYTAAQFPTEYRNDAFVPMRGSWNRKLPTAMKCCGFAMTRAAISMRSNLSLPASFSRSAKGSMASSVALRSHVERRRAAVYGRHEQYHLSSR